MYVLPQAFYLWNECLGRFEHRNVDSSWVIPLFHSGGTFPDDDGSHQQVKNSLFVGESGNRGMLLPDNNIWGPGGSDFSSRTLPRGM